jgi:glucose-6-phosphate-specific signal transduction histidine kinase
MGILDSWRFCPQCGGGMRHLTGRAECEACGFVAWANSIPAVQALVERDGRLLLAVGDDGVGGADPVRGSGLSGLAQRVRTVDGRLEIASPPGGPTRVTVDLPLWT